MTVAQAAGGSAPHGRPPRDDRMRGTAPPRHDAPPKRVRESEAEVVPRIETYEGAASPMKKRRPGNNGYDGGDGPGPRPPRGAAPGGPRGGSYEEPKRDAAAAGARGPPRQEGGPRREHPAEALRAAREAPRTNGGGPGGTPLPGPPPMPPAGGGEAAQEGGPNFMLSGVLAADTKRDQRGQVQKYAPPDDACMPINRWRIYIYKGVLQLRTGLKSGGLSMLCFFG